MLLLTSTTIVAISYLSSITSMANASPLDEEGEDDDETYCILFNNPLGIKKRGGKEKAIQGPNSKAKWSSTDMVLACYLCWYVRK